MKKGINTRAYYDLVQWKDKNMDEWLYKASNIYNVKRLSNLSTLQIKHLHQEVKKEIPNN